MRLNPSNVQKPAAPQGPVPNGNMSRLADEILVVLAQEANFLPARQELLARFYDSMCRQINGLTRRCWVSAADRDDAQGEGVFALLEAIARYDTGQLGRETGRSFRSFLRTVVRARFTNFLRNTGRRRRRYRPLSALGDLSPAAGCGRGRRGTGNPVGNDPCLAAIGREDAARLHQALLTLDDQMQRLWQQLAAGASLQEIAQSWGASYDQVRRRRRKLLANLAARLGISPAGRGFFRADSGRTRGIQSKGNDRPA